MKKIELLSPAGDMSKLKTALYFGADAVYIGGKHFSLRALAGNFTDEELEIAKEYIVSSFSSYTDSAGLLIDYYLGMAFSDNYPLISEVCDRVKQVTREDICNAFLNVSVDTVYFLNGRENN